MRTPPSTRDRGLRVRLRTGASYPRGGAPASRRGAYPAGSDPRRPSSRRCPEAAPPPARWPGGSGARPPEVKTPRWNPGPSRRRPRLPRARPRGSTPPPASAPGDTAPPAATSASPAAESPRRRTSSPWSTDGSTRRGGRDRRARVAAARTRGRSTPPEAWTPPCERRTTSP